ncbi:MAG TPA: SusC/RagA family TonB-linked outer membrane protein [Puia sp.]|nr:SusC/RagA family TonB-linked outer membrane protein [Puia sp.]
MNYLLKSIGAASLLMQGIISTAQSLHGVTLMEEHASLLKVLGDIRRQTGYLYFVDSVSLALASPISFSVTNAPVSVAMDSCVRDQPLFYRLTGTSIDVRPGGLVRGRVVDQQGHPIAGASVRGIDVKYPSGTSTDDQGSFRLRLAGQRFHLVVSCIGYGSREYDLTGNAVLLVTLQGKAGDLNEVIVSDGFQDIPRDRAAGSFGKVKREDLELRVLPSLVDRLDGVIGSLLVNKNILAGTNQSAFTIRGRSTIFSNPDPLIVIDNFPYNGDLSNLNPEDIESVTLLKDAAAASIWGTRAANGVVVIKTRQGKYNEHTRLSFSSSLTVGQKPNVYYTPILSPPDFIQVEQYLFGQGFYDGRITSLLHPALSPVVEILLQQRQGSISAADASTQLNVLRGQDTRRELDRYYYQPSINQQYWLGLHGGSATNRFFLSAGLDKDRSGLVRNAYDRITVNGSNTYSLIPKKLELTSSVAFTSSTTYNNNPGGIAVNYPYLKLADAAGNALAVPFQLRMGYVDTAGQGRLLDWHYRPLDELRNANNATRLTDYRLDFGLRYSFGKGWQAQALYHYGQGSSDDQNLQSLATFYTRNLLNEFTQVDAARQYSYPVPIGGILDEYLDTYHSQNGRLQLNYDHRFAADHDLHVLAGSDVQDVESRVKTSRVYGYDPTSQSGLPVSSYTTPYTQYSGAGTQALIPYPDNNISGADHYLSYYANGGYQYRQRYTVTASGRIDQSNLFGVNTNRKTVPLWSAGVAWELSREGFYPSDSRLSLLRLRLTDGYNGNVYKAVGGYTTVYATPGISSTYLNSYGAPTANITNPPNPDLRWEKVQVINAGLDFGTRDSLLEGSLDYYSKNGQGLIGPEALDPTSGNTQYIANAANMITHGLDLTLRVHTSFGPVRWTSTILFNFVRDRVTRYLAKAGTVATYLNQYFFNPLAGRPLYSVYALRWAGLDPKTGDPMGWLNGHPSENYAAITGSADFTTLLYKGPANPPFFGSWRNSFAWKQWGLSLGLTYKFGDFFTRPSIQYAALFNGSSGHPDYDRRWQQPGDERHTYVPSMIYPASIDRDNFYGYADVLIEKGDFIRLQDLQLFYDLPGKDHPKKPRPAVRFFVFANNIALLWTANKQGIDPDALNSLPNPRSVAVGCKMKL